MSDIGTMAEKVSALLKARGETIAVAESSAGGLISATLLAVPGASAYFMGGGVIYARVARSGLLGLPPDVVTRAACGMSPLAGAGNRTRSGSCWYRRASRV